MNKSVKGIIRLQKNSGLPRRFLAFVWGKLETLCNKCRTVIHCWSLLTDIEI